MPDQTIFERQMDELKIDMREMRAAVTQMANAMSKLAVLEERNVSVQAEVVRLNAKIAAVEVKATAMELLQAKFDGSVTGATNTVRVMWAVGGAAGVYFILPLLKLFAGSAS